MDEARQLLKIAKSLIANRERKARLYEYGKMLSSQKKFHKDAKKEINSFGGEVKNFRSVLGDDVHEISFLYKGNEDDNRYQKEWEWLDDSGDYLDKFLNKVKKLEKKTRLFYPRNGKITFKNVGGFNWKFTIKWDNLNKNVLFNELQDALNNILPWAKDKVKNLGLSVSKSDFDPAGFGLNFGGKYFLVFNIDSDIITMEAVNYDTRKTQTKKISGRFFTDKEIKNFIEKNNAFNFAELEQEKKDELDRKEREQQFNKIIDKKWPRYRSTGEAHGSDDDNKLRKIFEDAGIDGSTAAMYRAQILTYGVTIRDVIERDHQGMGDDYINEILYKF